MNLLHKRIIICVVGGLALSGLVCFVGNLIYEVNCEPVTTIKSEVCPVNSIVIGRSTRKSYIVVNCSGTNHDVYDADVVSKYVNKLNYDGIKLPIVCKTIHHEWRNFNEVECTIDE